MRAPGFGGGGGGGGFGGGGGGGSYERRAIEDWLTRSAVSPITGRQMLPSDLTVNRQAAPRATPPPRRNPHNKLEGEIPLSRDTLGGPRKIATGGELPGETTEARA